MLLSMEQEAVPRTLSVCSVTGQSTADIKVCITIKNKEEDRRVQIRKKQVMSLAEISGRTKQL